MSSGTVSRRLPLRAPRSKGRGCRHGMGDGCAAGAVRRSRMRWNVGTHLRRAPIPRWHGRLQHLPHALARSPEMPRRRALAHPLPACHACLAIQLHGVNPPALPVAGKGYTGRVLLRRGETSPPLSWSTLAPPFPPDAWQISIMSGVPWIQTCSWRSRRRPPPGLRKRERHRTATRAEKGRILDEFVTVAKCHPHLGHRELRAARRLHPDRHVGRPTMEWSFEATVSGARQPVSRWAKANRARLRG